MTRNARFAGTALLTAAALFFLLNILYSQQSNLQTFFLAPAAIRTPNSSVVSTIVEAEHLPYLNEVAKETKSLSTVFKPTPPIF